MNNKAIKSIYPFILLVALSSLYEIIFIYFLKSDSDDWSMVYLLLEFSTLLYVFTKNSQKFFRIISFIFFIVFIGFFYYFKVIKTEIYTLQSDGYLSLIEFLYVIPFSLFWFVSVFKRTEEDSLLKLPFFYFIVGLLVYFSGTIFLFLFSEEIIQEGLSLYEYWVVNLILVLFFRILLIVSIWKGRAT